MLEGPPVHLPAGVVQPLSMALHELATNAVKHGALGVPGGKVVLAWRLEGETLHLTWTERGGPPVTAPPVRRGFGSRVLEGTIGDQLGGHVRRHWRAEGLVAEFSLPLGGKEAEQG